MSAHSRENVAVEQGSRVVLEARAAGQELEVRWLRVEDTDHVVCRTLQCELDTTGWPLGVNRVYAVIYNPLGSLFLRYRIRILAPRGGGRGTRVVVPMIQVPVAIETPAADQFQVKATSGQGFTYRAGHLTVVGPTPRALGWDETVRSKGGAAVQLGVPGVESHVLGPRTTVKLAKASSGRRVLALTRGYLRSRQLDSKSPAWSVIPGTWLQVDGDAAADFVVGLDDSKERPRKVSDKESVAGQTVTVRVLRGLARVAQAIGERTVVTTIPAGAMATFGRLDAIQPAVVGPEPKVLQKIFAATTPQYLPSRRPLEEPDAMLSDPWGPGLELAPALALAQGAVSARDGMRAIEILAPLAADAANNAPAATTMANAYLLMGLHEPARAWLQRAQAAAPEDGLVRYLLGYVALVAGDDDAAMGHFEAASERGYASARLEYGLGVAAYRRGAWGTAKRAFTYALWEEQPIALEDSAIDYRQRLMGSEWLSLGAFAGGFHDGNLLRTGGTDLSTIDDGSITSHKGAGWEVRTALALWPVRSRDSYVGVTFNSDKKAFLSASQRRLSLLTQELALPWQWAWGGSEVEPAVLGFGGAVSLRTTAVGDERAMDSLRTRTALVAPAAAGLSLFSTRERHVDPLPGRNDVFDPVREEVVLANDRSSLVTGYGLRVDPHSERHAKVSVELGAYRARYVDRLQADEDYTDRCLTFEARITPTLKESWGASLDILVRSFEGDAGDTLDQRLKGLLNWRLHYTAALYQEVEASFESQTSPREGHAYKRPGLSAGLGFDW